MPKKLPFDKDSYLKMLDTKLGGGIPTNNVIDRLKQAEEERSRLSRLLIDERIFTTKIAEMIWRRARGLAKGECGMGLYRANKPEHMYRPNKGE